MKLKNGENKKYLQKHEVKINIKNNQTTVAGNAQIGAGLCIHKNQNCKEREKGNHFA